MTMEEIESRFDDLQKEVKQVTNEIENDAHMEFINSLREYVNKY